jgi:hypothetical protein
MELVRRINDLSRGGISLQRAFQRSETARQLRQ